MALRLISGSLISFLFLCSCHQTQEALVSEPVLVVNFEKLSSADFAKRLGKKLKSFDALAAKDPTNLKHTKEMILKDFMVSALLRQFALSKGTTISKEDLDTEFDRIRKSYPDDLAFKAALAGDNLTIEEWKENLRATLLEKKAFKLIGPPLDEEALKPEALKYYENHKTEFQRPAEVRIKQIVLSKKDDAERLLKAVKKGESFDALAKKFSISPDAAEGGDIGFVPKGVIGVFDSVFNYKTGQISPVLKSSYGFHIIKVIDKRSATQMNFDQAKKKIYEIVSSEKQQVAFTLWLETAIKNAKIEKNEVLINKISVRTEGTQE